MVNEERRKFLSTLKIMNEKELLGIVEARNIQNAKKLKEELLSEIVSYERLSTVKSLTVDQFKKEFEEEKRYLEMIKSLNFAPLKGRKTPEDTRPMILMRIVELKRLLKEVDEVFGLG